MRENERERKERQQEGETRDRQVGIEERRSAIQSKK